MGKTTGENFSNFMYLSSENMNFENYHPLKISGTARRMTMTFWTLGLPEGVLSNRPCPSVVGPSVRPSLNISETVYWFFLIFCMKLENHKGTKVTEPDF